MTQEKPKRKKRLLTAYSKDILFLDVQKNGVEAPYVLDLRNKGGAKKVREDSEEERVGTKIIYEQASPKLVGSLPSGINEKVFSTMVSSKQE